MNPEELLLHLRSVARNMGIVDLSVASVDLWNSDPLVSKRIGKGSRPDDLLPSGRSVIVIGVPIQKAIIETSPSIYYHQLYDTVNMLLDQATERLALELNILGYESIYIPRDGYHGLVGLREIPSAFFSHRHAAYLAGMGTFGYNNAILTEKYGPRIRFSSLITSAPLPSSKPMERELCIKCKRCTRDCPAQAVSDKAYPSGITRKQACIENSVELAQKGISPCGICIRTCPVGKDYSDSVPTDEFIENARKYIKPKKE